MNRKDYNEKAKEVEEAIDACMHLAGEGKASKTIAALSALMDLQREQAAMVNSHMDGLGVPRHTLRTPYYTARVAVSTTEHRRRLLVTASRDRANTPYVLIIHECLRVVMEEKGGFPPFEEPVRAPDSDDKTTVIFLHLQQGIVETIDAEICRLITTTGTTHTLSGMIEWMIDRIDLLVARSWRSEWKPGYPKK